MPYRNSIYDDYKKKTWIPKNNDKNLNQQIAMDF
jgi:hypothetical protein